MNKIELVALAVACLALTVAVVLLSSLSGLEGRLSKRTERAGVSANAGQPDGTQTRVETAAEEQDLLATVFSDLESEVAALGHRMNLSQVEPGVKGGGEVIAAGSVKAEVLRYLQQRDVTARKDEAARIGKRLERAQKISLKSYEGLLKLTPEQSQRILAVLGEQNAKVQAVIESITDNEEYSREMELIDREAVRRTLEVLTEEQKAPQNLKKLPKTWYGGLVYRSGTR